MMKDIENILIKAGKGEKELDDDEILSILDLDVKGKEFYELIALSNQYSRSTFGNKGYVFVQIGLNAEPCSGNCKFCSMGADHYSLNDIWHKGKKEVEEELLQLDQKVINDVFLMTTADYPMKEFLDIAETARRILNGNIRIVANIRDFNTEEAYKLKGAGITGAYHVNRLREGIDTDLTVNSRINTLKAIKEAGLELYYCIEPIGKEHSGKEILKELRRAEKLKPEVMAVMRRVNYPGSPSNDKETISVIESVKIAAVANLIVRPSRAMNLHESEQMSLLAGVNQLYAEMGANPRDTIAKTEKGRGLNIAKTRRMLSEALYEIL